ncbi:hypothetical protein TPAR_05740, partial [Tolypocladium paradoxum]
MQSTCRSETCMHVKTGFDCFQAAVLLGIATKDSPRQDYTSATVPAPLTRRGYTPLIQQQHTALSGSQLLTTAPGRHVRASLRPLRYLLLALAQLPFLLLLEVLLLRLGIQALELGVALRLARLLLLVHPLLVALLLQRLLHLRHHGLARGAHLLHHLGPELRRLHEDVGQPEEVGEQGQEAAVAAVRREAVLEEEALARVRVVERLGLFRRLVRDDEVLENVARRNDGGDQLRGEERVGDLRVLAHDAQPVGQLGVVLGGGERDVVAVLARLLHAVLVDDGPDEALVGALGILGRADLGGPGHGRDSQQVLLSVKGVQEGLEGVGRRGEHVGKEGEARLDDVHEGVEALSHGDFDVDKGRVLAARGVRGKLKERLLLKQHVGADVGIHGGRAAEADERELALQQGRMGPDPRPGPGAVGPRAQDVEEEYEGRDGEDEALGPELGERVALMDIVPLRPRHAGSSGTSSSAGERR